MPIVDGVLFLTALWMTSPNTPLISSRLMRTESKLCGSTRNRPEYYCIVGGGDAHDVVSCLSVLHPNDQIDASDGSDGLNVSNGEGWGMIPSGHDFGIGISNLVVFHLSTVVC